MSTPTQMKEQPAGSLKEDAAWATLAVAVVGFASLLAWLCGADFKKEIQSGDAAFVCGVFSLIFLLLPKYQAADVAELHGVLVDHKRRLGAVLSELRRLGHSGRPGVSDIRAIEQLVAQNEMYVAAELWCIRWLPFTSVTSVTLLAFFDPDPWLTGAFVVLLLWCTALLTRLVSKSEELLQHKHVWEENESAIQEAEQGIAELARRAAGDGTTA